MTVFSNFHTFAAARGEGLHPKLRLLFERAAASPAADVVMRTDGLLQSGPNPASETVPARMNVSVFPGTWLPQLAAPHQNPETPA